MVVLKIETKMKAADTLLQEYQVKIHFDPLLQ